MKKTLILLGLVGASVAANTSIKHRLGQVKAKSLVPDNNNEAPIDCPCDDTFNLPGNG